MFEKQDYSYFLPENLIAQEAIHPHHDARLMVINRTRGELIGESTFWNIDTFIPEDRILFFNNSRVQRARIRLSNTTMVSREGKQGNIVDGEIFFLEKKGETSFEGLVRPGKKFKVGTKIFFSKGSVTVTGITSTGRIFECNDTSINELMVNYGELPLPPYIEYKKEKEKDYQTHFAKKDGSVAAPTASLHFTKELLEKIKNPKHFLSLHVGLGTFKGIDTPDIRDYTIHSEVVEVPSDIFQTLANEKQSGKKVLAIGTTSCRSLESLPHLWKKERDQLLSKVDKEALLYWDSLSSDIKDIQVGDIKILSESIQFQTRIYIYPGIPLRIVDELITNFHLPESSLLLLVGAMIGKEKLMELYRYAIEKQYRFFSFGDGMYIKKI